MVKVLGLGDNVCDIQVGRQLILRYTQVCLA